MEELPRYWRLWEPELLAMLNAVAEGEDPEMVLMQTYANSVITTQTMEAE